MHKKLQTSDASPLMQLKNLYWEKKKKSFKDFLNDLTAKMSKSWTQWCLWVLPAQDILWFYILMKWPVSSMGFSCGKHTVNTAAQFEYNNQRELQKHQMKAAAIQ